MKWVEPRTGVVVTFLSNSARSIARVSTLNLNSWTSVRGFLDRTGMKTGALHVGGVASDKYSDKNRSTQTSEVMK